MDAASVARRILQLIPDETIEKIKSFGEPDINATIITSILQSTSVLPLQQTFTIAQQLRKLAEMNSEEHLKIDRVLMQKKKREDWERHKVWLIIAIVLSVCFIIYWGGK
jgi:serine protease inhibitor ecotin